MLDQYLNAVIQHNPSAVPLTPGYRQTENAVVRGRVRGYGKRPKSLGKVQRRYFDPVTQNVAYFGTLEETSGNAAMVTIRLKVADRKVAEAEWYLARKGDPGYGVGAGAQANAAFWDAENLTAHPPAERVVPKAERVSREDLISITNSYFDSLSARDGHIMMRILAASGSRTASSPHSAMRPRIAARRRRHLQRQDGLHEQGSHDEHLAVVARRFPIVDEEAGTVLGLGVFLRKPGVAMRRNEFSEWFVIDKGKLSAIYSSMFYPDQDALVPNWPPYDGNWPVFPAPK